MIYLILLSVLISGCATPNCCHGHRLPDGYTCGSGSVKDCEEEGQYEGYTATCIHYSVCTSEVPL